MGFGAHEVLWNTSENVGAVDLQNMQRFLRAFATDWDLGASGGFSGSASSMQGAISHMNRDQALWCLGDSAAPSPTHAAGAPANRTVYNLGGPLLQWRSFASDGRFDGGGAALMPADWGSDTYGLVYWVDADELTTTHAIGDATNPRWDLVCIRLSDVNNDVADQESRLQKQVVGSAFITSTGTFFKRRKVKLDKQVVVGTPAASPAMPAVPVGYLPYYAVKIPALFDAPIPALDDFHDYRMPLGSFTVDVLASLAIENGSGLAATGNAGAYRPMTLGASSTFDFVPTLPFPPQSCRLFGVDVLAGGQSGALTVTLGRYDNVAGGTYNLYGGGGISMGNLTAGYATGTDLCWNSQKIGGNANAGQNPPSATIKPPWGHGYPNGHASSSLLDGSSHVIRGTLGLRIATAGGGALKVARVRFFYAGGR